jgi:hypothetical protein
MKLPPWILPVSSYEISSKSAGASPIVRPPWTWPCTIIGLMMLPQSSIATNRRMLTRPVPLSISTTQMYEPNGKVRFGGS